jgi:hypothetical protein
MLPSKSIHTWKQFMELFLNDHEDYNLKKLWLEVENLCRHEGESVDDLFSIFMLICFRFHEKDQPSGEDALYWFLYLNSLSNPHDQENNDEHEVNSFYDMHVTEYISPSIIIDSRSNSIESTNNTEIDIQQQMLGFCDIHFQEQESVSKDSNFILNNDTEDLVENKMVEEDSLFISQMGIDIEDVIDDYINDDIALPSSHIEQGPLILTYETYHQIKVCMIMFLLKINEGYPIKREAFNFLHSESFYSLYPDMFADYSLHFDDFQVKTLYGQILV